MTYVISRFNFSGFKNIYIVYKQETH